MAMKLALLRTSNRQRALYSDAYIRISSIETNESGISTLRLKGYADQAAYQILIAEKNSATNMNPMMMMNSAELVYENVVTTKSKLPNPPSDRTYTTLQEAEKAAGYAYLKTLDEFKNSEEI